MSDQLDLNFNPFLRDGNQSLNHTFPDFLNVIKASIYRFLANEIEDRKSLTRYKNKFFDIGLFLNFHHEDENFTVEARISIQHEGRRENYAWFTYTIKLYELTAEFLVDFQVDFKKKYTDRMINIISGVQPNGRTFTFREQITGNIHG